MLDDLDAAKCVARLGTKKAPACQQGPSELTYDGHVVNLACYFFSLSSRRDGHLLVLGRGPTYDSHNPYTHAAPGFEGKAWRNCSVGGRAARIEAITGPDQIQLKILGSDERCWATVDQLTPFKGHEGMGPTVCHPAHADPEDEALAQRWCDELSGLPTAGRAAYADRQAIAERMGVHLRTVSRRYASYLANAVPASQLRQVRGRKPGSRTFSPALESIIDKAIDELYLTRERPTIVTVQLHVKMLCKAAGFSSPSYNAICARVKAKNPLLRAKKRYGAHEGAALQAPSIRGLEAARPLEIVQIDHALVDLIVVNPDSRKPIGRPWITLAIDVFTRAVVGYYLGFEPPNQTIVGLALHHACFPKAEWLQGLGVKVSYPMFGRMQCVHWDNAKTFRSWVPGALGSRNDGAWISLSALCNWITGSDSGACIDWKSALATLVDASQTSWRAWLSTWGSRRRMC
jgi:hypothetical protein